jgi:hypothetical protein
MVPIAASLPTSFIEQQKKLIILTICIIVTKIAVTSM